MSLDKQEHFTYSGRFRGEDDVLVLGAKRIRISPLVFLGVLIGAILLSGCKSSPEVNSPTPSLTSTKPNITTLNKETSTLTPNIPTETATPTLDLSTLPGISLCNDNKEGDYCIFSLGFSSDQQVITLKRDESAAVDIILLINSVEYYCQTIEDYPGNLYCIGPLILVFEGARVEILSLNGEVLIGGIVDLPVLEPVPTKPSDDPGYY
jgi:hypothetical protein